MSVETVNAEVVVIGGGMVGLASAIALRDRGLDVLLCDPGRRGPGPPTAMPA